MKTKLAMAGLMFMLATFNQPAGAGNQNEKSPLKDLRNQLISQMASPGKIARKPVEKVKVSFSIDQFGKTEVKEVQGTNPDLNNFVKDQISSATLKVDPTCLGDIYLWEIKFSTGN